MPLTHRRVEMANTDCWGSNPGRKVTWVTLTAHLSVPEAGKSHLETADLLTVFLNTFIQRTCPSEQQFALSDARSQGRMGSTGNKNSNGNRDNHLLYLIETEDNLNAAVEDPNKVPLLKTEAVVYSHSVCISVLMADWGSIHFWGRCGVDLIKGIRRCMASYNIV